MLPKPEYLCRFLPHPSEHQQFFSATCESLVLSGWELLSFSLLSEKENVVSGLLETPVSLCVPALQADNKTIAASIIKSAVIRVFTCITPSFLLASV
jgi:hypothetical protein